MPPFVCVESFRTGFSWDAPDQAARNRRVPSVPTSCSASRSSQRAARPPTPTTAPTYRAGAQSGHRAIAAGPLAVDDSIGLYASTLCETLRGVDGLGDRGLPALRADQRLHPAGRHPLRRGRGGVLWWTASRSTTPTAPCWCLTG